MTKPPSNRQPPSSNRHLLSSKKVAIVHDWLIGGGAEKVVLELHRMFPDAPIYTSYATDEWRKKLDGKVVTGWLQYFGPLRKLMPYFREKWFSRLDLADYDIVISSSGNGEARAVKAAEGAVHINYCHAVNQFYWTDYERYLKSPGQRPYWLMRLGLKLLVGNMRRKDYQSAQNPDIILANSTAVASDIKEYLHRDAVVVFPPVDTDYTAKNDAARDGFVTMGRLVPWKRVDLIVSACSQLGVKLTVIGTGPELNSLKSIAGPSVRFAGWLDGQQKLDTVASHNAFIMANAEPFGIAPVEAMSTGTPIIAYKAGGALDYVQPGKTGEFFNEQTVESLKLALANFKSSEYNSGGIKTASQQFSVQQFHKNMHKILQETVQ